MSKSPIWLLDYRSDIYSQAGEDGIIAKVLDLLQCDGGWCVEFGAWDGLHLSNTRNLIDSRQFSAILIEADSTKYQELRRNYANQPRVIALKRMVGFNDSDGLDAILRETPIPEEFDLLSIDIDGNDYHAWRAIRRYRPKVVVIEYNHSIPTPVLFVQSPDPSIHQGSSLLSLTELGREKGYELVCVLEFNAVFVRREYYPLFEIERNTPEDLRASTDKVTYLFSGFDGTIFLRGNTVLPWHGIRLTESAAQAIPRCLRSFPLYYTPLQKIMFACYLAVTDQRRFFRESARLLNRWRLKRLNKP